MLRKKMLKLNAKRTVAKSIPAPKKRALAKKARFAFPVDAQTAASPANGHSAKSAKKGKANGKPAPERSLAELSADTATAETAIIAEKIKELLKLSQDQGHLTYDDI